ncbi:hypothetical protein [Ranid herpesvirus 3]|uniref:Uncharacterized protein n=1 Tax=Ranid herpesvirus 3 TaxID=1987509 RepID=A0A1X9T588_9VIRU|nr:hypothetical protein [Ranid herpesvirus 3]ARR28864.1 hypothetical protein [Ranid herpesvirus 3]
MDPMSAYFQNQINVKNLELKRQKAAEELSDLRDNELLKALTLLKEGENYYNAKIIQLEEEANLVVNSTDWAYVRMETMIKSIFNLLKDYGDFYLEIFQREIIRAFVLGVATRQLGNQIHRYKHKLLSQLLFDDPDILTYDPQAPSQETTEKINKLFKIYESRYTAAIVPRRCGKSTILEILLATAIIYLEIDILVQAHRNNTCSGMYDKVIACIARVENSPWFDQRFKIQDRVGDKENQKFESLPSVKSKAAVVHFMPSGPHVSYYGILSQFCSNARFMQNPMHNATNGGVEAPIHLYTSFTFEPLTDTQSGKV